MSRFAQAAKTAIVLSELLRIINAATVCVGSIAVDALRQAPKVTAMKKKDQIRELLKSIETGDPDRGR